MESVAEYTPRERTGKPSTARVQECYDRYVSEPLYIDCEHVRRYTQRHREVSHWEEQERSLGVTDAGPSTGEERRC